MNVKLQIDIFDLEKKGQSNQSLTIAKGSAKAMAKLEEAINQFVDEGGSFPPCYFLNDNGEMIETVSDENGTHIFING